MIQIEDLLGIPFKYHGRDKNGFDCYGLAIEVSKRFGHKLVDMYSDYSNTDNEAALEANSFNIITGSKLIQTSTPTEGDVVLFFDRKNRLVHIGIYLKNNDFIHCDTLGVRVSSLKNYFRKWSVFTWQS